MSANIFTNFENLYGTNALLKAMISSQNQLLVDKGVTTEDELKSRLKIELVRRNSINMDEVSTDGRNPTLNTEAIIKPSSDTTTLEYAVQTLISGYDEGDIYVSMDTLVNNLRTALQNHLAKKLISTF
jgi:hypothetical protein